MSDKVDHPSHYNTGKFEVIDVIEDWNLGFNLGNTVKYIGRAGKKDPAKVLEDLQKAKWYLEREISRYEVTFSYEGKLLCTSEDIQAARMMTTPLYISGDINESLEDVAAKRKVNHSGAI